MQLSLPLQISLPSKSGCCHQVVQASEGFPFSVWRCMCLVLWNCMQLHVDRVISDQ